MLFKNRDKSIYL